MEMLTGHRCVSVTVWGGYCLRIIAFASGFQVTEQSPLDEHTGEIYNLETLLYCTNMMKHLTWNWCLYAGCVAEIEFWSWWLQMICRTAMSRTKYYFSLVLAANHDKNVLILRYFFKQHVEIVLYSMTSKTIWFAIISCAPYLFSCLTRHKT